MFQPQPIILNNLGVAVNGSVLFDPLNLWSLWVPLGLLMLIFLAAIYFIRASIR